MAIDTSRLTEKLGPFPVWGWALLIVGGGYLIYQRKKNPAVPADTVPADTAASPSDYSAALLAADYSLTNSLGVLNSNVGSATTAINANTGAEKGETAVSTKPVTGPTHAKMFIIPGGFNQKVNPRLVAASLLPSSARKNKNAVEAMYIRLLSVNPGIKGRPYLLGGHQLVTPNLTITHG